MVVQRSGDGTNCSLPPGLSSGSGSTSTIAAADQESFGVLLGGGLPFRLHLFDGGIWMSVSCSFFCSLSIPGSDVAFLFLQRALTCSQLDSLLASADVRPRWRVDVFRRLAPTPTSRCVGKVIELIILILLLELMAYL